MSGDAQARAVADAYASDDDARAYVEHRRRSLLRRIGKAFETARVAAALRRAAGAEGTVLDAACGSGRLRCDVACDLAPGMARIARAAGRCAVRADCLALPFRDDGFRAAACVRLIHHFDAPQRLAALRELARVAEECVVTYFGDRGWRARRRRRRGSHGTRRALAPEEFASECTRAGLRVVEDFAVLPGFSEQRVARLARK